MRRDDVELAAVVAVSSDEAIGDDGGIPWDIPADMRRFRELTMGCPVVVGRRTYESIVRQNDGPPDGRSFVVVTRENADSIRGEARTAGSPSTAAAAAKGLAHRTAFVAGGGSIYEELLPVCDRAFVTHVPGKYPEADTRLESMDWGEWERTGSVRSASGCEFSEYVSR